MLAARPFASDRALFETAEQAWWTLSGGDWLEAFAQHPRIGERDKGDARARSEQAGPAAPPPPPRRAPPPRDPPPPGRPWGAVLPRAPGAGGGGPLPQRGRG